MQAVFNILCEQPETVAAYLVPRIRTVAARGEATRYIRFLTLPRAIARFLGAPFKAGRFFNSAGAQWRRVWGSLARGQGSKTRRACCILPHTLANS